MSSVVQAQWDLSATSTDVLSIGRGVLIAATSDNVQPLAIMACERFGATLAMGRVACDHVNDHVLPTPDHAVVGFLKAMVGFSKDDSATELGRSHAGVQFLALASALLSTMSAFDSAAMVWAMLKASASDGVLLPRQSQVKDLLARLEPRCKPSPFFERAQWWQLRVRDCLKPRGWVFQPLNEFAKLPTTEGVEKLVGSFRQLRRIGSASVLRIEIRTPSQCAAWVAAFTEWCLDEEPSVNFGAATPLVDNSPLAVEINLWTSLAGSFEVILHHKVDGPRSLVRSFGTPKPWTGMAKVEHYGDWLFRQYEFDDDLAAKILRDVLPSALHQVAETLTFSPYKAYDTREPPERWRYVERRPDRPQIEHQMRKLRVYPFPGLPALSRTLGILTKGMATKLSPFKNGDLISHDPTVKKYLRSLRENCDCGSCASSEPASGSRVSAGGPGNCDRGMFFTRLSTVICDVYALSLFHYPEGLSVQIPIAQHSDWRNDLRSAVENILHHGRQIDVSFTSLLDWALSLAGHGVSKPVKECDWIMSSDSGQVVWPAIYDTNSITKYGFLGLSWLRGELRYEDEVYKSVQSTKNPSTFLDSPDIFSEPVVAPLNLVSTLRVDWEVQPGDGVLKAAMRLSNTGRSYGAALVSPSHLLANYASALMMESCPHASDTPLADPDAFGSYTGPRHPTYPASENTGKDRVQVGVVAVDGANELRFFAIACGGLRVPVLLRRSACLGCCLDVCKRTGFPVLVL